jgi:hypothetical protein
MINSLAGDYLGRSYLIQSEPLVLILINIIRQGLIEL